MPTSRAFGGKNGNPADGARWQYPRDREADGRRAILHARQIRSWDKLKNFTAQIAIEFLEKNAAAAVLNGTNRKVNKRGETAMNKTMAGILCALLLFAAATIVGAQVESGGHWDGLIEVKPKRLDTAYLLAGADFRPYRKLMIDPVEVAFMKDWAEKYNRDAATLSQRLTQEDVQRIAAAARDNFTEVFNEAYKNAGLELVTTPGADVLRVRPGVVDLYITAPDTMSSGRSRTFNMESGQATLFIEVRDSTTGALLGRALDRRATRNSGRVQISNSVTNLSDFRALFKQWADISVKGFNDLRAMSPVPADLKPGQKLEP